MLSETGFIYGLVHAGEVRYVGKTIGSLDRRLKQHLTDADRDNPSRFYVRRWIQSVNFEISIIELEQNPSDLGEAEKAWIATLRLYGCRLTNMTDGGDGCVMLGLTPWNKGKRGHLPPETRARMSASAKARDPNTRAGNPHPGSRTSTMSSEELGQRIREGQARRIAEGGWDHASAGRLAGLAGVKAMHTPEVRARAAASNRLRWQSYTPEERQRRIQNTGRPRKKGGVAMSANDSGASE